MTPYNYEDAIVAWMQPDYTWRAYFRCDPNIEVKSYFCISRADAIDRLLKMWDGNWSYWLKCLRDACGERIFTDSESEQFSTFMPKGIDKIPTGTVQKTMIMEGLSGDGFIFPPGMSRESITRMQVTQYSSGNWKK